jgi:hypothetical protein
MAKREKHPHQPGVGCSIRAFCYRRRFLLASFSVACLYLTHVLWLMNRYKNHDLLLNPVWHIPGRPSLEKIYERRSENELSHVNMDDDSIHIVFSTGCNSYQDCTFFYFHLLQIYSYL